MTANFLLARNTRCTNHRPMHNNYRIESHYTRGYVDVVAQWPETFGTRLCLRSVWFKFILSAPRKRGSAQRVGAGKASLTQAKNRREFNLD